MLLIGKELRPLPLMPSYIYINGYPGIGKLTIAKELEKLIPNSKVYHNHLFIDPIAPLVDRDSPHYHDIRTSFRRHILNTIATSEATARTTWIFTDSRSSDPIGSTGAQDYENAANLRGALLIPIILHCEMAENLTRVMSEERGTGNTKLRDAATLENIRLKEDIYTFGGPYELKLDITNITASEAAEKIYEHLAEVTAKF
ncbi:hypothetical protein MKX08_003900 [Trichoderma sp. CBMAI-0020]|nr:hypothetical protein MKX08_003900 [Trichoderma sp. CBMAI-0020]